MHNFLMEYTQDNLDQIATLPELEEKRVSVEQRLHDAWQMQDYATVHSLMERRQQLLTCAGRSQKIPVKQGQVHFRKAVAAVLLQHLLVRAYEHLQQKSRTPPPLGSVLDYAHLLFAKKLQIPYVEKTGNSLHKQFDIDDAYSRGLYKATSQANTLLRMCLRAQRIQEDERREEEELTTGI